MKHEIQDFPRLTIERLSNGLIRFEDDSCMDGPQLIDAHPCQVQIAASMLGFTVPDKARQSLKRAHDRIKALSEQAAELEGLLDHALNVQDLDVTPERKAAQFIALNLSQVVQDLADIQAPDLEPMPDAPSNQGGQLTLPV